LKLPLGMSSWLKAGLLRIDPEKLSLRRFIVEATREPGYLLHSIGLGIVGGELYKLARVLGKSYSEIYSYYKEIIGDRGFLREIIGRLFNVVPSRRDIGGYIDVGLAPYLYVVVRALKPSIVVETGVGPGMSSSFILRALAMNGFGTLYSIDLPNYDLEIYKGMGIRPSLYVPEGLSIGWLVPPWLRAMWGLVLGDTRIELPRLLRNLGSIDMFLHDSLHTYQHMLFEYMAAYRHLRYGGLLLSDDVGWNTAFGDFCHHRNLRYIVIRGRLGVGLKVEGGAHIYNVHQK